MSITDPLLRLIRYGLIEPHPPTPPFLILFVTKQCNMRCRHCFDAKAQHQGPDLTGPEIARLSKELGPVPDLMLSGGEPFLRQDLANVCSRFAHDNSTRQLSIPTNGFDTRRIVDGTLSILDACPRTTVTLNLSLDGLESTHDNTRSVPGAFRHALETGRSLLDLAKERRQLNVNFVATLTSLNCKELPDLSDFLRAQLGADLQVALLRGDPRDPSVTLPPPDVTTQTLNAIEKRPVTSALDLLLNALRKTKIKTYMENRQIVPCAAGRLVGVVYANGDLALCELLPPVGNLRQAPFPALWNGPQARAQRKSIEAKACACTHECFLWPSLVYSWRLPFRILQALLNP